jgi:predicted protein tyrosine phosphatase
MKEEKKQRAGSLKQAAAMMGLPIELLKAAKNAGAVGIDDHGRVDCEALREWMEDPNNAARLNSPVTRKDLAIARHEEIKVERAEWRFEAERGLWVERKAVAARLMRLATEHAAILRSKLECEFPALLEGKSLEERRVLCVQVVDQLHEMMQGLVQEWAVE